MNTAAMSTQVPREESGITSSAPVMATAELEIDAPIATVWEVLTAIERWPAWNPDVKSVAFAGHVAEGSTFTWKAGPGTIRSIIEHVDRPRLVAWSGKTLGIRAVHVWRLEERNGKTLVRTEESYDGLVARVLRRSLQKTLDKALANAARYLKAAAERAPRTAS